MKKVSIVFASLFLLAILYSSCRSHETCPAYGKTTTKTSEKLAS